MIPSRLDYYVLTRLHVVIRLNICTFVFKESVIELHLVVIIASFQIYICANYCSFTSTVDREEACHLLEVQLCINLLPVKL